MWIQNNFWDPDPDLDQLILDSIPDPASQIISDPDPEFFK